MIRRDAGMGAPVYDQEQEHEQEQAGQDQVLNRRSQKMVQQTLANRVIAGGERDGNGGAAGASKNYSLGFCG